MIIGDIILSRYNEGIRHYVVKKAARRNSSDNKAALVDYIMRMMMRSIYVAQMRKRVASAVREHMKMKQRFMPVKLHADNSIARFKGIGKNGKRKPR